MLYAVATKTKKAPEQLTGHWWSLDPALPLERAWFANILPGMAWNSRPAKLLMVWYGLYQLWIHRTPSPSHVCIFSFDAKSIQTNNKCNRVYGRSFFHHTLALSYFSSKKPLPSGKRLHNYGLNHHRNSGFSHEKWWFSIAMLVSTSSFSHQSRQWTTPQPPSGTFAGPAGRRFRSASEDPKILQLWPWLLVITGYFNGITNNL